MKHKFLTNFGARRFVLPVHAFLLLTFFASLQPAGLAQTTVLTRREFAQFTLAQRARFFEPTISRIAAEEAVDPYLLWTIAYNETRFRPWLRSYAGAEGLMQFIPATAARFNLFNPYLPEPAIRAAARYVRFLSNRFGGRIDSILAGYNAGEGAVDAFLTGRTVRNGKKIINPRGVKTVGGVPPYQETIGYVARGLVVYRLLRSRQMFPGNFILSVYPPAVSESVARISLRDAEIGFNGTLLSTFANPNFLNANTAQQINFVPVKTIAQTFQTKIPPDRSSQQPATNFQTSIVAVSTEPVSTNSKNENPTQEMTVKDSDVVFYEPRTGGRFKARDGQMERLEESGEIVVGSQTVNSQPSAVRARGTLFGGKPPAPK